MMLSLCAFYFLVFCGAGVFMPWFPPFLAERGFSPARLGLALGLSSVCRAFVPPLWGWLVDRFNVRRATIVIGTALSGLALLATARPASPDVLFALLLVYGILVSPVMPLTESITLGALGKRGNAYGRIRLWGSIGFVVTALGLGLIVRRVGLAAAPWLAGGAFIAAAGAAVGFPAAETSRRRPPSRRRLAALARRLAPVLVVAALGQAAHGPYYTFFTLDLTRRGVAPWLVGSLWAWAVIVEIGLLAASPGVLTRLGLVGALRWSLALGAARWLLYVGEPALGLLVIGQALHAASFALLHIASVQLIHQLSPADNKSLGQSVLSACAYGVGGGGGVFLAGQFFTLLGLPTLYLAAGAFCLAGLLLSLRIGERP